MLGCGVSIQVLQDYFTSHIDVAVGPPRPLVTGESYQELEDRLTTGFFHSIPLSLTVGGLAIISRYVLC